MFKFNKNQNFKFSINWDVQNTINDTVKNFRKIIMTRLFLTKIVSNFRWNFKGFRKICEESERNYEETVKKFWIHLGEILKKFRKIWEPYEGILKQFWNFLCWRGVWRCMHVKLAPQTPQPLDRDRLTGPASEQGGRQFWYTVEVNCVMVTLKDTSSTRKLQLHNHNRNWEL